MKRTLITLLLLSLALTGCVIGPGRGYGDHGGGDRDHPQSHDDRGQHDNVGHQHGDVGH